MKTVLFLRAEAGTECSSLPALLPDRPWAALASRIVVQMPVGPGDDSAPPVYDAIVELWSDEPLRSALAADPLLTGSWQLDIRESHEVVGKEGKGPAPAGLTPGLSQLTFIRAMDALSRADVERHWSEHIPLACAIHVGMERYVQDRLSTGGAGAEPWFGMAHLHFPDEEALRVGLFRTPEDVKVITADVAEFVSAYATMLANEHVVKG